MILFILRDIFISHNFLTRIFDKLGVAEHHLCDLLIGRAPLIHFGHKCIEVFLIPHIALLRENFRDDLMFLVIDEDFIYRRIALEVILNLLGRNILSVAQDYQVLHATGQENETILIDMADVPGPVPAIIKSLRGRLRIFIITEHADRAFELYFTLFRDTHLCTRDNRADTAVSLKEIAVNRNNRRTLRRSVPVQDLDSQVAEHLDIKRVEGCAAAN